MPSPGSASEDGGVTRAARRAALKAFGRLPRGVRRRLVRLAMPSFTVGCLAVLRDHGRFLILQQRHRAGWTLPGGLLHRGERPVDGLRREIREELGVDLPPTAPAATLVDPAARRVDLIFAFDVAPGTVLTPRSDEIEQIRWSASDDPGLSPATRQAIVLLAESESASREIREVQLPCVDEGGGGGAGEHRGRPGRQGGGAGGGEDSGGRVVGQIPAADSRLG